MKRIVMWVLSGIFMLVAAYSVYTVLNQDTAELKVSGQTHYINNHNISKKPVQSLEGKKLNLGHELTADINIINFWASWCEPCNKEMPELVEFHKNNKDIGLIGLNINDKAKDREDFMKEHNVDYEVVVAKDEMIRKYKIYNIPTTFFTDKNGKVLKTYVGELDENKLKRMTESLKK